MSTAAALSLAKPHDIEFFERELATFLPDRIFDAHCHVWESDRGQSWGSIRGSVGYDEYKQLMRDIHGDRPLDDL